MGNRTLARLVVFNMCLTAVALLVACAFVAHYSNMYNDQERDGGFDSAPLTGYGACCVPSVCVLNVTTTPDVVDALVQSTVDYGRSSTVCQLQPTVLATLGCVTEYTDLAQKCNLVGQSNCGSARSAVPTSAPPAADSLPDFNVHLFRAAAAMGIIWAVVFFVLSWGLETTKLTAKKDRTCSWVWYLYCGPVAIVVWIFVLATVGVSLGMSPAMIARPSVQPPQSESKSSAVVIQNLSATTVYAGGLCPSQYRGQAYALSLGWWSSPEANSSMTDSIFSAVERLNDTATNLKKSLIAILVLVLAPLVQVAVFACVTPFGKRAADRPPAGGLRADPSEIDEHTAPQSRDIGAEAVGPMSPKQH